jgi:histidyl-tRNA synthetase
MGSIIKALRGMKDILPNEVGLWQFIESEARNILRVFGFSEIRVPMMERTELFARSIGENTDIVEKEMYTFVDRSGESLTLRPEATASILRAYLERGLHGTDSIWKLYCIGPMFRHERPQKGRYRQFNQIDAEILGSLDPRYDAEVIDLIRCFFSKIGIEELEFHINTLGCPRCRPAFREVLKSWFLKREDLLCTDCRRRIERNPLRILDCKVEGCKDAIVRAPVIFPYLCEECRAHFDRFKEHLDLIKVPYIVNERIVRGLDYYTKTTFEVISKELGAQNAVAGGGRYDGLMKELGGPDIPATGFAIGVERVVSILSGKKGLPRERVDLFIAALGPDAERKGFQLVHEMRRLGFGTEMDYQGKGLKAQMRRADKLMARFVLILGEMELSSGKAILRDMETRQQYQISIDKAPASIESFLRKGQVMELKERFKSRNGEFEPENGET